MVTPRQRNQSTHLKRPLYIYAGVACLPPQCASEVSKVEATMVELYNGEEMTIGGYFSQLESCYRCVSCGQIVAPLQGQCRVVQVCRGTSTS